MSKLASIFKYSNELIQKCTDRSVLCGRLPACAVNLWLYKLCSCSHRRLKSGNFPNFKKIHATQLHQPGNTQKVYSLYIVFTIAFSHIAKIKKLTCRKMLYSVYFLIFVRIWEPDQSTTTKKPLVICRRHFCLMFFSYSLYIVTTGQKNGYL